jgi:hypothetical protein
VSFWSGLALAAGVTARLSVERFWRVTGRPFDAECTNEQGSADCVKGALQSSPLRAPA